MSQGFRVLSFLIFLASAFLIANTAFAVQSCVSQVTKAGGLTNDQLTTILYTAIEFGNTEKTLYIHRVTGQRRIVLLESEHTFEQNHALKNVFLDKDAESDAGAYYAEISTNLGTDESQVMLYSLNSEGVINRKLNTRMNLTWKT